MMNLMILFAPNTYVWIALLTMTALTVVALWGFRCWRRRWLRLAGLLLVLLGWVVLYHGVFVGPCGLDVRRVEIVSADLPAAFDGYRIVQFSDAHVASFTAHRRQLLQEAVDSMLAQHADLIVFTGDLQNKLPDDITPYVEQLSRLKARDSVFAVLGNHDYPMYVDCDPYTKQDLLETTASLESKMGWCLLSNHHRIIRRGNDSIVIAGMENDGEGRFPQLGNINHALYGLSRQTFIVMLEHDPTAWRRKILPECHAQLTLSGHTHGGQLSLLGLSPAAFNYQEHSGMYHIGHRAMNVSTGLSGVVPFRVGVRPEIVVITLKRKK